MNREARVQLASETVDILEAGQYVSSNGYSVELGEILEACVAGTRCFEPEDLFALRDQALSASAPSGAARIELMNESTLEGAFCLRDDNPDARVGVLNFGSAKNPGGGFLKGSQAQEESLARASGLYKSLLVCPSYYDYHRESRDPLYSHRLIYSPDCPIFRNESGILLDVPRKVDFFTCPAPNAAAARKHGNYTEDEIVAQLRERVTLVLGAGLYFGITHFVLGAWGCGVFRNEPRVVAKAFRDVLSGKDLFKGRFSVVRFSVLDTTKHRSIWQPFADVFDAESGDGIGA